MYYLRYPKSSKLKQLSAFTVMAILARSATAQTTLNQSAYIKDANGFTAEMADSGSFAFDYPTIAWAGDDKSLVHVLRDRDGDGDFKTGVIDRQIISTSVARASFALQGNVLVLGDHLLDGARGGENCGGVVVYEWNDVTHQFESVAHLATLQKSQGLGSSVAIDGRTIVAASYVSGELVVFRTTGEWSDIDTGLKGKRDPVLAANSLDDPDCVGCGQFVVERTAGVNSFNVLSFGGGSSSTMSHALQVHEASNTIAVGDIEDLAAGRFGSVYVIEDGDGDWPDGAISGDTQLIKFNGPIPTSGTGAFGNSLDLIELPSGELRLLAGSMLEEVDGNWGQGAAHVFDSLGGSFSTSMHASVTGPNPSANGFGYSVCFGGEDLIFVGSPGGGELGGKVYEYQLVLGSWTPVATIVGNNTEQGDGFGRHVVFSDGGLLVAAPGEDDADTAAITIGPADPESDVDDAPNEGALYHFR